jgi:hypothetical protein
MLTTKDVHFCSQVVKTGAGSQGKLLHRHVLKMSNIGHSPAVERRIMWL